MHGALLLRLSSSFPGRWPGVGLLLLRAVVGLPAVVEGVRLIGGDGVAPAPVIGAVIGDAGVSVLAGLLTSLSAAVVGCCGAVGGLEWIPSVALVVLHDPMALAAIVTVALAIVLLGPGAYSLDSYFFGRREIVIK